LDFPHLKKKANQQHCRHIHTPKKKKVGKAMMLSFTFNGGGIDVRECT